MPSSPLALLSQSAVQLAALMRSGQVSPVAVVDAFIARIELVNPAINAVVADRFATARTEARAAEKAYAAKTGDLPPFLGVPCTIKEAIALEGMPNTSGSFYRKGLNAPRDAVAVARMKAAGFIPLGVTNVPECCFGVESDNVVYGRTRNPHDLGRIAGGSSGGEAAIVSARGAPLGIGSDLGGSIRMPALFNGIFGHKPSAGLVPITGHFPFYHTEAGAAAGPFAWTGPRDTMAYNTIGPLASHAGDLMPVLRILSGKDDFDACCEDFRLEDPAQLSWRGRRVFLLADPDIARTQRTSPDQRAAVERAGRHLEERGAIASELPRGLLRNAFKIWAAALHAIKMPALHEMMGGGKKPFVTLELARLGAGGGRHTLPSLQYQVGERLYPLIFDKPKFVAELVSLTAELTKLMEGGGLLLMPTYPTVAPRHYAPMLTPFNPAYTAIVNVLKMPATAIPMGVDARGLPLGVQALSVRGRDDVTIAAALALEEGFGGAPHGKVLAGI